MNENEKQYWWIECADRKPTIFEVIDIIFYIVSISVGAYVVTKTMFKALFIFIWGVEEAIKKIKEDKEKEETEEETDN